MQLVRGGDSAGWEAVLVKNEAEEAILFVEPPPQDNLEWTGVDFKRT